jgi:predicted lipid-binding transport protein (Tim44 family)
MKSFWMTVLVVFALVGIGATDAQAKRLGGGQSMGKQAPSNTLKRDSAPAGQNASPGTPASPAAAPSAAPQRPAAPQAAPASRGSRWMGPLAGLAAGLGLAALASHFGFGEELANAMMMGLIVMAVLAVVGFFMARRAAARGAMNREPAYAGAGGYSTSTLGQEASVPQYAPLPTSADRSISAFEPVHQPSGGSAGALQVPADFDVDAFVRTAKVCFVRLQASYDAGNMADLREFTSPEMYAELKLEIDGRKGGLNQTDVVTLEADLLGVHNAAGDQLASVRFTGMIREEAGAAAQPFDEVWNFARPVGAQGGWVLAGIQQLTQA